LVATFLTVQSSDVLEWIKVVVPIALSISAIVVGILYTSHAPRSTTRPEENTRSVPGLATNSFNRETLPQLEVDVDLGGRVSISGHEALVLIEVRNTGTWPTTVTDLALVVDYGGQTKESNLFARTRRRLGPPPMAYLDGKLTFLPRVVRPEQVLDIEYPLSVFICDHLQPNAVDATCRCLIRATDHLKRTFDSDQWQCMTFAELLGSKVTPSPGDGWYKAFPPSRNTSTT
jgi:hypothetical protein